MSKEENQDNVENEKSQHEKKERKNSYEVIRRVIFAVSLITFVIAGYQLINVWLDYRSSEELYNQTMDEYVKANEDFNSEEYADTTDNDTENNDIDNTTDTYVEPNKSDSKSEDKVIEWFKAVTVDLERIQKKNKDIIGWIHFENMDLSYPILYSGDNDKYLRMSYTGKKMTAGSIFVDGRNTPDFSDSHTIIYGHNMRNKSMFGKLKYFRKGEDYYKKNQYFQIITNDYYYRYRIFAYKQVSETSDVYTISFESIEEFGKFLKDKLIKGRMYNTGVKASKEDKIITLSTCSTEGNRFIVSAVRVAEHKR